MICTHVDYRDFLHLSVRIRSVLDRLNVKTIYDITQIAPETLMEYKNFGETSLTVLRLELAKHGLSLYGDQQAKTNRRTVTLWIAASPDGWDCRGWGMRDLDHDGTAREQLERDSWANDERRAGRPILWQRVEVEIEFPGDAEAAPARGRVIQADMTPGSAPSGHSPRSA